jgi:hypothetical protein
MDIVMGKVRQRNWLLIITGCLLLASVLVFFVTTRKKLGMGLCQYDDIEYTQGQIVPNYKGRNDCYCSWSGEIVCEQEAITMSYENFSSDDLQFTYSFRNFLEKDTSDPSRVILSDVNYKDQVLEIILEREALCTQEGQVPPQTAMYKKESDSLTLTTITNRDESLYGRVCLIGNTFVIKDLDLLEKSEYSIYYQHDDGSEFKLKSCFVNGKLYGQGDVFKDSEENLLCTCEDWAIECEEL